MSGTALRVLVVAPFPPSHTAPHGGARAVAGLVDALDGVCTVRVLCAQAPDEPAPDVRADVVVETVAGPPDLRTAGQRALRIFGIVAGWARGEPRYVSDAARPALTRRIQEVVREWSPDVIQLEHDLLLGYAGGSRPPVRVLTVHDPGRLAAETRAASARRLAQATARIDAAVWRRFERRNLPQLDGLVAFSAEDAEFLREAAPEVEVVCVPLVASLPPAPADLAGDDNETVVFVGNFSHHPNVDAADWLVRTLLPRVRERVPSARVLLVGANGRARVGHLEQTGVDVTDTVPEVEPYLARAAVVVAPIRTGGGARVKVQEALAAGRAVVATRRAAAGLAVHDGVEVRLEDTDADFADAVSELLLDGEQRSQLGRAARRWAERELDWGRTAAAYVELYGRRLEALTPGPSVPGA